MFLKKVSLITQVGIHSSGDGVGHFLQGGSDHI